MKHLTRVVSIALEVDTELLPDRRPAIRATMANHWASTMHVRLLPCKGGVRIVRGGKPSEIYATPTALADALFDKALGYAVDAGSMPPFTATWRYCEDRAQFYCCAADAVLGDPRCLRMWGIS